MKILRQAWQERTDIPQRSRYNNSGFQFVWDCHYSPEEKTLSGLGHGYFKEIAVASAIYDTGRYACLAM